MKETVRRELIEFLVLFNMDETGPCTECRPKVGSLLRRILETCTDDALMENFGEARRTLWWRACTESAPTIVLNEEDSIAFARMLLEDREPPPALIGAAKRYREWRRTGKWEPRTESEEI